MKKNTIKNLNTRLTLHGPLSYRKTWDMRVVLFAICTLTSCKAADHDAMAALCHVNATKDVTA